MDEKIDKSLQELDFASLTRRMFISSPATRVPAGLKTKKTASPGTVFPRRIGPHSRGRLHRRRHGRCSTQPGKMATTSTTVRSPGRFRDTSLFRANVPQAPFPCNNRLESSQDALSTRTGRTERRPNVLGTPVASPPLPRQDQHRVADVDRRESATRPKKAKRTRQ